ncbi:MAG: hypothetical protein R3E54_13705 [Halioglobus sp.]
MTRRLTPPGEQGLSPVRRALAICWLLAALFASQSAQGRESAGGQPRATPVNGCAGASHERLPCFEAALTPPHRVTLRWKSADPAQPVYLYDDFGVSFHDPGEQPAVCETQPGGVCEITRYLPTGGYYRWVLQGANDQGDTVHVSASLSVPAAPGPRVNIGGSPFLDAQPKQARRLTWRADETLTPCSADAERAWIEIRLPGEALWSGQRRYPRCGAQAYLDIPATALAGAGEHIYLLRDCHRPQAGGGTFCSTEVTTGFHASGAPALATIPSPDTLVDNAVRWELRRDIRFDFDTVLAYDVLGVGEPLDITYDADGGVWMVNEFSTTLEHVTPAGEVRSFTVPLGRGPRLAGRPAREVTRPFAIAMDEDVVAATAVTSLAERVMEDGALIWFTQGGGLLGKGPPGAPNHSRVVAFARNGADRPDTHYDDRLCAYNMPLADDDAAANHQVVGLAASGGRLWVGESRGLFSHTPSAISAFIPQDALCNNLLVFEQPDALASQALQFCDTHESPQQHGCMQRRVLVDLPPQLRVAHLAADPVDGKIWFTDARGGYLGRLDPRDDTDVELFAFPDPHAALAYGPEGFGGFPWTLRVDGQAVYIGEYLTRHIIRFDKQRRTFSEIAVPAASQQIMLHSLDIDTATARLWFTLTNESRLPLDRQGSTVGYIDLNAWTAHLHNPQQQAAIPAVVYRGLHRVPASNWHPLAHQAFRGIAVEPRSGRIALATMHRRQITELRPRKTFRAPLSR